jgi:hypothetical protein
MGCSLLIGLFVEKKYERGFGCMDVVYDTGSVPAPVVLG